MGSEPCLPLVMEISPTSGANDDVASQVWPAQKESPKTLISANLGSCLYSACIYLWACLIFHLVSKLDMQVSTSSLSRSPSPSPSPSPHLAALERTFRRSGKTVH